MVISRLLSIPEIGGIEIGVESSRTGLCLMYEFLVDSVDRGLDLPKGKRVNSNVYIRFNLFY